MVELPFFTFDDLRDDHQFVESGESVNARTAAEGLQNPHKLRHFKERCWRKLVDLQRKCIENSWQDGVTGEPQPTDKEIPKYDNFSVLGSRDLLVKRGTPSARREEPAFSYSRIVLLVTFDSPKASEGGNGPEVLALIRSSTPASTSPMPLPLSD
jgi:hypothetical protein